ncbi:hypothetical protein V2J09_001808 [Rumex salicifolius]
MNCLAWNCRGVGKDDFITTTKYLALNYDRVEAQGFKGGILVLWNEENTQIIAVYAPPTVHRRRRFWQDVRDDIARSTCPVIILGDFNCILNLSERIGRSGFVHSDSDIFEGIIHDLALIDLGFSGQATTWSRGESTERFVANWPNASVRHLLKLGSDHTPLLVTLDPSLG